MGLSTILDYPISARHPASFPSFENQSEEVKAKQIREWDKNENARIAKLAEQSKVDPQQ